MANRHAAIFLSMFLFAGSSVLATPQGTPPNARDHYVPNAGYLRTVQLLAFRRNIPPRVVPGAPGQVTSLSGRRAIPTLLVEFNNKAGRFTAAQYHDHLFGDLAANPPAATISKYYRDMSLGQFEVRGDVIGWLRLPKDDTHYEGGGNGSGTPFGEFLSLALDQADLQTDFGEFDNDGPDGLPNSGDDDGIVDTVFFVHPEPGGECQTMDTASNIWSHSWHFSEETYGHTGPYETNDVQLNRSQVPVLNPDGTEKHIVVEDYTVQPGLACPTGSGIPEIVPIGVYTHEYGHALGLPDLYDRTPSGNPDSNGIGEWGLMAGGSWGFGGRPETPTRMTAWCLARMGWANIEILDPGSPSTLTLESVQVRNRVLAVDVQGGNGTEYFLIELKDPDWIDPSGLRLNWDADLPQRGLAIWHIDDGVGADSETWPFAPLDKGQNDAPSIPDADHHALVALEQADCLFNLESKNNSGDTDDLWVTGQVFGDETCRSSSIAYDGTVTGFTIENIDLSQLRAELRNRAIDVPPAEPALAALSPDESSGAAEVAPEDDAEDDSEDEEMLAAPVRAGAPARAVLTSRDGRRDSTELVDLSATSPEALGTSRDAQGDSIELVGLSAASPEALSTSRDAQGDSIELVGLSVASRAARNTSLERVNKSLERRPNISDLSTRQKAILRRASNADIENSVSPDKQKQVKVWASRENQYEIKESYEPANQLEVNLKELWQANGASTPIQAQMDATSTRVDRVTGLKLPAGNETLAQDAKTRSTTTLRGLVGENVDLKQVEGDPNFNAQTFQQVYKVDDTELPVYSKGASLYYDQDRALTAIATETIDSSELVVSGKAGQLSSDSAQQIAAQQLRLPASRASKLVDSGEGIYLVDQDPSQARVVRRMTLPGSGKQEDIVVYIDAETRAVVGIE